MDSSEKYFSSVILQVLKKVLVMLKVFTAFFRVKQQKLKKKLRCLSKQMFSNGRPPLFPEWTKMYLVFKNNIFFWLPAFLNGIQCTQCDYCTTLFLIACMNQLMFYFKNHRFFLCWSSVASTMISHILINLIWQISQNICKSFNLFLKLKTAYFLCVSSLTTNGTKKYIVFHYICRYVHN